MMNSSETTPSVKKAHKKSSLSAMSAYLREDDSDKTTVNWRRALSLLCIIAFWEFLIMLVLPSLHLGSEWAETLVDTGSLSILSSISIWYMIILPEATYLKKTKNKSFHFMNQQMEALDKVAIISVTDLNGKITYANDNFCGISGYSRAELLHHDHRLVNSGFHSKKFFKEMWTTLAKGKIWSGQVRNKKKDGGIYWVDSSIVPVLDQNGNVVEYVSIRFDITHEKLTEANLAEEKSKGMHLSRLSALGEMAAGIAHEINNPLAVISGVLSLNQLKLKSPNAHENIPKIIEANEKALKQVGRITKIILGLKSFTHAADADSMTSTSLNTILESVKGLCEEKLKRSETRLEIKSDADILLACRSVQIEQVLVNLVGNSIDAIKNLPVKWIQIEISKMPNYVGIRVTDSGAGIPPEIAGKLMQSFFTTKPVGQGTGLGLSISRGIILNHGGEFKLDTQHANTSFVISLPLNDQALINEIDIDEFMANYLTSKEKIIESASDHQALAVVELLAQDVPQSLNFWLQKVEGRFQAKPEYQALKLANEKFQKCIEQILIQIKNGDSFDQEKTFGSGSDFSLIAEQLTKALYEMKNPVSKTLKLAA